MFTEIGMANVKKFPFSPFLDAENAYNFSWLENRCLLKLINLATGKIYNTFFPMYNKPQFLPTPGNNNWNTVYDKNW